MKFIYIMIITLSLSACVTNENVSSDGSASGKRIQAIMAFEDVCLKTAPSFIGAAKTVSKYGISELTDAGFMKMGFNKDKSLGVQIKENKECVITTPQQRRRGLSMQFLQTVGRYATGITPGKMPVSGNIGGSEFIFGHDRRGGEAFVMLKVK